MDWKKKKIKTYALINDQAEISCVSMARAAALRDCGT